MDPSCLCGTDSFLCVAGCRHDELSAREKPGTSFKLLGIKTWRCIGTPWFFSPVRLDASVSAAGEVNKNGLNELDE